MTKETKKAKTDTSTMTIALKGFNKDLTCTPDGVFFQYEVGKTFEHQGSVKACKTGFHVITGHPLALFKYYAPAGSVFHRVEIGGQLDTDDDEKTAAQILKVGNQIGMSDLVNDAVKWVMDRAKPEEGASATGYQGAASATGYRGAASATGDQGAASATGYQGAASATGYQGAASATGYRGAASATGDQGAASATGDQGAASATGYQGAASATGYQGAASATGYQGAASATGYRGAASATGDQGAASATGYQGAASATGYQGAASATGDRGAASATGDQGAASATGDRGAASATGDRGAALASGYEGRASGKNGNALFLCERDDYYNIVNVWAGIVGKDGIQEDVFYMLKDGKPVEVKP